jgi:SAM-dependent methyltransferase
VTGMAKRQAVVSDMDKDFFKKLRENINRFIEECSQMYDEQGMEVLDIAPQVHGGAKEYFTKSRVRTLDIDPSSNCDFIADLCRDNSEIIPDESFDVVLCTEVLEHTLNPFGAAKELFRIVRKGGVVCASTPFNFRIHGPLPDCWRFTEHGLAVLFSGYSELFIYPLETPDRDLMPIGYTLRAIK